VSGLLQMVLNSSSLLKSSGNAPNRERKNSSAEIGLLLTGFMVSFLVALLAIKTFLAYIRNNNFIVFGVYRLVVAIAFIIFVLI
jgi:undecaprenyl pyrophosphate phosphatase UppP